MGWSGVGWGGLECHMVPDVLSNAIEETRHLRTESHTFKPKNTDERDTHQMGLCLLPSAMPVRRLHYCAEAGSVAPEAAEAGRSGVDAEGLHDSCAVQKQE